MSIKPQLSPQNIQQETETWVVFSNETDLKILKVLRKNFRHCFVVMHQDNRWILIDPRVNKTDIVLLPHPSHFNLPAFFQSQGMQIVKTPGALVNKTMHPYIALSCVGITKRLIGLRGFFIVTPYQLYKKLMNYQKGKKNGKFI